MEVNEAGQYEDIIAHIIVKINVVVKSSGCRQDNFGCQRAGHRSETEMIEFAPVNIYNYSIYSINKTRVFKAHCPACQFGKFLLLLKFIMFSQ